MEVLDEKTGSAQVADKTVGILAYCTLIGFIIAIVMNGSKEGEEKKFGAFHLRQALGLIIVAVGAFIAMAIIGAIFGFISLSLLFIISFLNMIIGIGLLVLLILQIVAAANGEKKELPIVGKMISKMFGTTFE